MSGEGTPTPEFPEETDGASPGLVDLLPPEVLSCIMVRVNAAADLDALACTCRQFRSLARVVPFTVKLSQCKFGPSSRVWTRGVLKSIRCYLPSTRVLDLAGTWIVDDDVAAVLADLKNLDCLVLDGCQKLTSCVADALAVSVRTGPRTVSLQRCFGVGPTAAGNLLAAAAVNGSRLECILFSHLDRLDIPRDTPLVEAEEGNCKETSVCATSHWLKMSAGAGLHILALNNCAFLGLFELVAVATTCPQLEIWMLGGSVEGLGLFRSENLCQERMHTAVSALVKAIELLPKLSVLEMTFFPNTVVQSLRQEIRREIQVWDFCQKSSVMSAILYLGGCTEVPMDCSLEYSKIKNIITDIPTSSSKISDNTSKDFNSQHNCFKDEKRKTTLFKEDLVFALHAAANCSDTRRRTPLHVAASSGDSYTVQCLLAIGAEARGMKDSGGATALFVAAECGYADVCELLLQGGADVLAFNRAGENPLYIAALRGHCEAVEVLVRHCCKNNINWQIAKAYGDGWTPLMAAAVADRQDVAKILLKAININLSSHLDGNNFSESAICAVKDKKLHMDKCDIYTSTMCKIIQEYHSSSGSLQSCRDWKQQISSGIQLLDAQNRYGQTALHIAARRASIWFVCNLLIAGASMDIQDCYMMRAVDVAYHHNHKVVANIIKNWDAIQRNHDKVTTQHPSPRTQKGLRSKSELNAHDASKSSSSSQLNKNRNTNVEVQKRKDNTATISSGKLAEDHGRSIVAQRWRVKGGHKREISPIGSSSGT
uniref:F-box domain-containing protein n=1 Tax=Araucaria cunninghamii TaxID=56994 RepID=A0A0D6QUM4_ARACU